MNGLNKRHAGRFLHTHHFFVGRGLRPLFTSAVFVVGTLYASALMPAHAQTSTVDGSDNVSSLFDNQSGLLEQAGDQDAVIDLTQFALAPIAEPADNQTEAAQEAGVSDGENQPALSTEIQTQTPALTQAQLPANDLPDNVTNNVANNATNNVTDNQSATADQNTQNLVPSDDGQTVVSGTISGSADTATNTTTRAGRIGRRSLSNVGLVSIGLRDDNPLAKPLNSLVWRQSEASQLQRLIEDQPADLASFVIRDLVRSVLRRQAVPPAGAADNPEILVRARLDWLARTGQSHHLAELIRRLPEHEIWADYKRWIVEYDLLTRRDSEACQLVSQKRLESLDPFWHKSQIICYLIEGNETAAYFGADLLRETGDEDVAFFALVDQLMGRRDQVNLTADQLEPIHVALMDAAGLDIPRYALLALPASFDAARGALRNLERSAYLELIGHDLATQGLVQSPADLNQHIAILRRLYDDSQPLAGAIGQLESSLPPLHHFASASALSQLVGAASVNDTDYHMLLLSAFAFEASNGRGLALLPVYHQLITTHLQSDNQTRPDDQTRMKYARIHALSRPSDPVLAVLDQADYDAQAITVLLNTASGDSYSLSALDRLEGWQMMPLLAALGQTMPQNIDWTQLAIERSSDKMAVAKQDIGRLDPPLLYAIEEAAKTGLIGETILLIGLALDRAQLDLGVLNANDATRLVRALQQIGFEDAAIAFGRETLRAKLLAGSRLDQPLDS